jgi:phage-related minor tail protein
MLEIARSVSYVDQEIKKLDRSINAITKDSKDLDKSLKLSPDNVVLTQGKIANLEKQIQLTTEKIKAYTAAQKQMSIDVANGKATQEQYDRLGVEIAKCTVQAEDFRKQIKDINNASLEKFKAKVEAGLKTAGKLATSALKAIYKLGTEFAETGDAISDASNKYNVSAEQFQRGSFLFERASGSSDAYSSALNAVQSQMSSLAKGSAKAKAAFEMVGIDELAIQGLNTSEVLDLVTQKLSAITDEDERLTAANALLSEAGYSVAEVAGLSASEVSSLNSELEANGIMSEENVEKAASLQDSIDSLKSSFSNIQMELAAALQPALESLIGVMQSLMPIIQGIANVIASMPSEVMTILVVVLMAVVVISKLVSIIKMVKTVMAALNAVAAANPFVLIALAVIALIALIVYLANLLKKVFGKKYELETNTDDIQGEAQAMLGDVKINQGDVVNNYTTSTYNDYSTTQVEAHTDADLDDIAEQLSTKIKVGGGR